MNKCLLEDARLKCQCEKCENRRTLKNYNEIKKGLKDKHSTHINKMKGGQT